MHDITETRVCVCGPPKKKTKTRRRSKKNNFCYQQKTRKQNRKGQSRNLSTGRVQLVFKSIALKRAKKNRSSDKLCVHFM